MRICKGCLVVPLGGTNSAETSVRTYSTFKLTRSDSKDMFLIINYKYSFQF